MMKKVVCAVIVIVMSMTFMACGSDKLVTNPEGEQDTVTVTDEIYLRDDETGTREGTYTGEWRDGKRKYEYVKTQTDGTKTSIIAEGTFIDGKLNGDDCSIAWDYGLSYTGQMKDGDFHGWGVRTTSDGSTWTGQYSYGLPDGPLKAVLASGWTYDMVWSQGVMVSGKIYQGSNLLFEGEIPPEGEFTDYLFGSDPEPAERGLDDEQFLILETAVIKAITEAEPDAVELKFTVPELPFAVYKIRKALEVILATHAVETSHLAFSSEQAYIEPDDPKSGKAGVTFSVFSVTQTPFSTLQADIERFYSEAAEVADMLPDDPREAVIALDKYICETFEYDYEAFESGRLTNLLRVDDITIGDFFDNKHGVCSHYAIFSYAVLMAKDIPVRLCISPAHFMNHEWYQVLIDGVWLNVDSTWNDAGESTDSQFLLLSDEKFRGYFDNPHYNWIT